MQIVEGARLSEIQLFLLGLVVSAEIIPRDYLYPMKESLCELPSQLSEILSLLTICSPGYLLGISESSLYYLQVFVLALVAIGCQHDIWSFPPPQVEDSIYQFLAQNEATVSSFPVPLQLHIASIFARLDTTIQPSAHQLLKREKWLTSCLMRTMPPVVPPKHIVTWLWNQQPLREWNQKCLDFWLFEVDSHFQFFLYTSHH